MMKTEYVDKIPGIKDEDILIRFVISTDNKCHIWWNSQFKLEQVLSIMYWEIIVASVKSNINLFYGSNN